MTKSKAKPAHKDTCAFCGKSREVGRLVRSNHRLAVRICPACTQLASEMMRDEVRAAREAAQPPPPPPAVTSTAAVRVGPEQCVHVECRDDGVVSFAVTSGEQRLAVDLTEAGKARLLIEQLRSAVRSTWPDER